MDFRFSAEDQAFRAEVREFVQREWDPKGFDTDLFGRDSEHPEARALVREFEKKLAAKGWNVMHWPRPWGPAAPIDRQLVYREEMAYQGAPVAQSGGFFPMSLMINGQDWQRDFFLPKVANADIEICQGFSEPNAGSDLANLQTRAVRDGDDYVINGQKIWTSFAHISDWGHFLVRTDPEAPKHRGISYLLIDMKSPGITLRPIYNMLGVHLWNETFLDNVRVPVRNLIGEENQGWYAAMTTLSFERSSVDLPAGLMRALEAFLTEGRKVKLGGQPIVADPVTRHQLAELRIEIEIARMMSYRVAWMQRRGETPVMEASITKVVGSELLQRVYRGLARIIHEAAVVLPGGTPVPAALLGGFVGYRAFNSIGLAIAGGANEVQRNIIAQRGLGLPR